MKSSTYNGQVSSSRAYVKRLGKHHFGHLRAVAEGIDLIQSARLYLGVEHGHQAKTAHQEVVESVRAIARRHNESAWRLIGLSIQVEQSDDRPTLSQFSDAKGLDGWSEDEVAEMYAEAYPAAGGASLYKANRRLKLRERQLDLIRKIELLEAEIPQAKDLVAGWFDDVTSKKMVGAGILNLGQLNTKVSAGGRWFSAMPGIGETKARRIESHLATLLPREARVQKAIFSLNQTPSLFSVSNSVSGSVSDVMLIPNRPPRSEMISEGRLVDANTDFDAVEAWVKAKAGSVATAKIYRREGRRLLLWLQYECQGKEFAAMTVEICRNYLAFLQLIPERWISRDRAAREQPGWAPFRGQLSHKSQRQAVVIIGSLFQFLLDARYLPGGNPWSLINKKSGDDKEARLLDTKALSEVAFREILSYVKNQPPSPSRSRMIFILLFVEAVGLRSAELLNAKLRDFSLEPEGWMLQVHGKGSKNRVVAIPGQAVRALQDYLSIRELGGIETAPPDAPLLASTLNPIESVGYQALYEHVKGCIRRAVAASALPSSERSKLAGATTHWLRHTFGTRAVARQVPVDVLQAQMGHASVSTTLSIYGRAPMRRRADELAKAFG